MRLIDADALIADCQLAQKQADRHGREFANAFYSGGGEISTEWWCVEDLIENAPTIEPDLKWIPCSERLPEEDGDYLVLYYTRSPYKPYAYDVMSFANDLYKIDEYDFCDKEGQKGWFYCDREYGYCEDIGVTAWMPLPKPYKEGEQE